MPKIIKKKRIKILPFLIFILVIAGIVFLFLFCLNTKIENIIVTGNKVLKEQEVLEIAEVNDYPSFYKTTSSSIKSKLKEDPLVKEVNVKKSFFHVLSIEVEEYKVLLKREDNGKLVLENKKEITTDRIIPYTVPKLVNYIPNTKYDQFIKGMLEINDDVRSKISEISYVPNEFDKDRFLLYMDDGNSVYLTLTKFKMINYYNDVLPQLEGKKGYLYLDSGNHFQIMQ